MKNLLNEIQKLFPPRGASMRMLDPGAPGSLTMTILEVVGRVEFVLASQAVAGRSLTAEPTKQKELVMVLKCGKTSERSKSPAPEQTRTPAPECAKSPIKKKTPEALARL